MFGLLRPSNGADSGTLPASYMSVYCDLCAVLSLQYGLTARPLIVHDIASLGWLLEPAESTSTVFPRVNCVRGGTRSVRPPDRRATPRARLLAALSCYAVAVKLRDDLSDRPSWRARALKSLYSKTFTRANLELERLGFPLRELEGTLAQQDWIERQNTDDLHAASGPTGRAYAVVSQHLASSSHSPVSAEVASGIGDALGRCVYVIDAYRDVEADEGVNYNPLCCGTLRSGAQLSSRRREAREYVAAQLRSARDVLGGSTSSLQSRWQSIERRLRSLVGLEPATVTLNATCCVPCGDGAVAFDDKECWPFLCGCSCCACYVCGKLFG